MARILAALALWLLLETVMLGSIQRLLRFPAPEPLAPLASGSARLAGVQPARDTPAAEQLLGTQSAPKLGASRLLPEGAYRAVREIAPAAGVDPLLVDALIWAESSANPSAVGPAGASGMMQLLPDVAARFGVDDVFDAGQNIRAGVLHLKELLDRYEGDVATALAAYNAGPAAVDRHAGIPAYRSTHRYVRHVLAVYRRAGGRINPGEMPPANQRRSSPADRQCRPMEMP